VIPTTVKTDHSSQQQAKTVTPVRPVTPVLPAEAVADPGNTKHEFVLGQRYQARVERHLPNGNFNVLISNKLVQMQLPENFLPGDKLELLLLSNEPRLKFELQNGKHFNSKSDATISLTGKFIDVLIQDSGKSAVSSPAVSTPILTDLMINKQEFPFLLQKAIHQSGLFYESHLFKWITGKSSLEKLQLEPQNKLKNSIIESQTVTPPLSSALPASAQSLSLIQQQLIALETGHIMWRGEVWNGQHMEWNIYEDSNHSHSSEPNTAKRWKTTLKLTFPELGKITATLILNTQNIQIKLNAENPDTQQLLINSQTPLKTNLQSTGMAVAAFTLHSDD
jgi:Flagellar hook-length control protein FliK